MPSLTRVRWPFHWFLPFCANANRAETEPAISDRIDCEFRPGGVEVICRMFGVSSEQQSGPERVSGPLHYFLAAHSLTIACSSGAWKSAPQTKRSRRSCRRRRRCCFKIDINDTSSFQSRGPISWISLTSFKDEWYSDGPPMREREEKERARHGCYFLGQKRRNEMARFEREKAAEGFFSSTCQFKNSEKAFPLNKAQSRFTERDFYSQRNNRFILMVLKAKKAIFYTTF